MRSGIISAIVRSCRLGCLVPVLLTLSTLADSTPTTLAATAPTSLPTTSSVAARIDVLIAQLSADQWKVREQAQDELVMIGEAAIPKLKEMTLSRADLESRSLAAAVQKRIADNRVSGQSLITLHLHDVDPAIAFEELARQGHTEFGTWPSQLWTMRKWPTVSLDVDQQPMLLTLRDLCSKTSVQLQNMGGERKLCIVQAGGNWMSGPISVNGPFLVIARQINHTNSVDLTQPLNINHDFSIYFWVFAEPKLNILGMSYGVNLNEATDDQGHSLLLPVQTGWDNLSNNPGFPLNVSARLSYPANAGTRIKTIRGTSRCVIQVHSEVAEFADIMTARNVTQQIAGRAIQLKQVTKQANQYTAQLILYRGSLSNSEWDQFRNPQGQIRMVDDKGESLTGNGWGASGGNAQMELNMNFSRAKYGPAPHQVGEPVKLIWECPTETRELPIAFRFDDLPLP